MKKRTPEEVEQIVKDTRASLCNLGNAPMEPTILIREGTRTYEAPLLSPEGQRALQNASGESALKEARPALEDIRRGKISPPVLLREGGRGFTMDPDKAEEYLRLREQARRKPRPSNPSRIAWAFLAAGAVIGSVAGWTAKSAREEKPAAPLLETQPVHAPRPPSK